MVVMPSPAYLHTSKRMHFIEDIFGRGPYRPLAELAYVKTYALH